jgi:hypothetical protein
MDQVGTKKINPLHKPKEDFNMKALRFVLPIMIGALLFAVCFPAGSQTKSDTLFNHSAAAGPSQFDGKNRAGPAGSALDSMAAAPVLYGDYGAAGLWQYDGTTWTPLSSANPDDLTAAGPLLYADFGALGVYSYNGTSWTKVATLNPEKMMASGSMLYADFAGMGLYQFNGTTWTQLTTSSPEDLTVPGAGPRGPRGPQGPAGTVQFPISGSTNSTSPGISVTNSVGSIAVRGQATNSGDVINYGGYFEAYGKSGNGVFGAVNGSQASGVYGLASGATAGVGVYGKSQGVGGTGVFGTAVGYGVMGYSTGGANSRSGVYGETNSSNIFEAGVWGVGTNGASGLGGVSYSGHGVMSRSDGTSNSGIYAEGRGASGFGGYFVGSGTYAHGLEAHGNGDGIRAYAGGTYKSGVYAVANGSSGYGGYLVATAGDGTGIYAEGGSSGRAAYFRGNVVISSRSTGATVMELGEGLDYAEGFNVQDKSRVSGGTVLAIDPKNPGRLTMADRPYDTRVAGIAAGAKSLGSGVRLGAGQYDVDIALAGRVYCNVDATYGEVSPGDLLTTSPTPGYAMAVGDHGRAQGAILGKAMESLSKGSKGQILVLVTLQ